MVFAAFFAAFFILRFLEEDLTAVDITAAAVPTARLTPTVFIAEFMLLFIIFSSVLKVVLVSCAKRTVKILFSSLYF